MSSRSSTYLLLLLFISTFTIVPGFERLNLLIIEDPNFMIDPHTLNPYPYLLVDDYLGELLNIEASAILSFDDSFL